MASGGEAHDDDRMGIDMVAFPVIADIGHSGKELLLRDRPAALRGDMVAKDESSAAQSGEPQGDRFTLPVGQEVVATAGADNEGGAQSIDAQLREIIWGVRNKLGRPVRAGDQQGDDFMDHGPASFLSNRS